MNVPIGKSTWAVWIAAAGAALAFIVEWSQSGIAPEWLAGIAGILILANNAFRSWQATVAMDEVTDVPEQ